MLLIATSARPAEPPPSFWIFPAVTAWNLSLNSALIAPPAMIGTRGYFALEGDRFAAYDIEHGTLLWLARAHVGSPAAAGDDLVFLAEPDQLVALKDDTGALAWRVPFAETLAAPLVWKEGWLIATTASGSVLAYRARDGGLIWRNELRTPIHGTLGIAGDRLYVPLQDGRVAAMLIETGQQIWERKLGGAPNNILALDDQVFVGAEDGYFYTIRASNGDLEWRWPTGGNVVGLPVVDDRHVYFVSYDNVLRGMDRRSGAQRWKRGLPLRPTRGLVALNEMVFVSGVSDRAFAYLKKDGRPAGALSGPGELTAPPHPIPGAALPSAVVVTTDFEHGVRVSLLQRAVEPDPSSLAPLPNLVIPTAPGAARSE